MSAKKIAIGSRVPTFDGPGEIIGFKTSDGVRYAVVKMEDERKGTRTTSVEGIETAILVARKRY